MKLKRKFRKMTIIVMSEIYFFIGNDFVGLFTAENLLVWARHCLQCEAHADEYNDHRFIGLCLSISGIFEPLRRLYLIITKFVVSLKMYLYSCVCIWQSALPWVRSSLLKPIIMIVTRLAVPALEGDCSYWSTFYIYLNQL